MFVQPVETSTELAAEQICETGGTVLSTMARQGGRDLTLWLVKILRFTTACEVLFHMRIAPPTLCTRTCAITPRQAEQLQGEGLRSTNLRPEL